MCCVSSQNLIWTKHQSGNFSRAAKDRRTGCAVGAAAFPDLRARRKSETLGPHAKYALEACLGAYQK
jgi:hypothetical protein